MDKFLKWVLRVADQPEPVMGADEVWAMGGIIPDYLINPGVIRRMQNAAWITCDECDEDHVERVTYKKGGKGRPPVAYIQCPTYGRVFVKMERLAQWAPDYRRLAEEVAQALDMACAVEELVSDRVWCLGITALGARQRQVFMVRGLNLPDAEVVMGGCEPLNAAKDPLVLVAGEIRGLKVWKGSPPMRVALRNVVGKGKDGLVINREFIEDQFPKKRRKVVRGGSRSFPVPPGTRWSQVRLEIRDRSLVVEIARKRKVYTFEDAGFADGRRKGLVPDRHWTTLNVLAIAGGLLPSGSKRLDGTGRENLKQGVKELRKILRVLIPGIDGDPIPYCRKSGSYRAAMSLATTDGLRLSVPSGTKWRDVTIALPDRTAVKVTVVGRARGTVQLQEEIGNAVAEVVEHDAAMEQVY